ncbi:MAG TPA: hypothetical protein VE093_33105 [Polyangiaceae bacterium]|nr:hypothetical protein [Polyangiaceae bacterium]
MKLFVDFRNDKALLALAEAGMNADVPAMLSALPAGTEAYELHIAGLNRWIASMNRGAFLSKKVIQVANITMIAISIYQVWKLPAIPAGGSPTPPTILGTLPGGAAVGSVSLPSLARALEAIRRLVAIGALDGALIGGIGSLGGGPSIALPELQRPTSLSVQGPGGSTPKLTAPVATSGDKIVPKATTPVGGTVDDVLRGATRTNPGGLRTGRAALYERPGGFAQANADFNGLSPVSIASKGGGIRVGQLPDGRTVIVRPSSSQGSATLEIQGGAHPIKIRYGN